MHLIYRNILLEQREAVRDLSLQAWKHALESIVSANAYSGCIEPCIQEWFALALKPTILGYDSSTFAKAEIGFSKKSDEHDIDKGIMTPDFSLIAESLVFRNRVDAVMALAQVASFAFADVSAMNSARVAETDSTATFLRLFSETCFQASWYRRARIN